MKAAFVGLLFALLSTGTPAENKKAQAPRPKGPPSAEAITQFLNDYFARANNGFETRGGRISDYSGSSTSYSFNKGFEVSKVIVEFRQCTLMRTHTIKEDASGEVYVTTAQAKLSDFESESVVLSHGLASYDFEKSVNGVTVEKTSHALVTSTLALRCASEKPGCVSHNREGAQSTLWLYLPYSASAKTDDATISSTQTVVAALNGLNERVRNESSIVDVKRGINDLIAQCGGKTAIQSPYRN